MLRCGRRCSLATLAPRDAARRRGSLWLRGHVSHGAAPAPEAAAAQACARRARAPRPNNAAAFAAYALADGPRPERLAVFMAGLPASGKTGLAHRRYSGPHTCLLDLDDEIRQHPSFDPQHPHRIYYNPQAYEWADERVEGMFQRALRDPIIRTLVRGGSRGSARRAILGVPKNSNKPGGGACRSILGLLNKPKRGGNSPGYTWAISGLLNNMERRATAQAPRACPILDPCPIPVPACRLSTAQAPSWLAVCSACGMRRRRGGG